MVMTTRMKALKRKRTRTRTRTRTRRMTMRKRKRMRKRMRRLVQQQQKPRWRASARSKNSRSPRLLYTKVYLFCHQSFETGFQSGPHSLASNNNATTTPLKRAKGSAKKIAKTPGSGTSHVNVLTVLFILPFIKAR